MAEAPEPPELARVLDFAERSRAGGWSLRSALTRYAQPQPQRASDILDLVRRLGWALQPRAQVFAREGPAVWAAASASTGATVDDGAAELVRAASVLDGLGEVMARWADDTSTERPDAAIDSAITDVAQRLDRLGVPKEDRRPPPSRRRG